MVRARVLAAEELLASKLFVVPPGRAARNGADVAHIICQPWKLNWERVLALVGEHWEMLPVRPGAVSLRLPAIVQYVPPWYGSSCWLVSHSG